MEVKQEYTVVCDTDGCDYKVPNTSEDIITAMEAYIDKPCPSCGANLLTQEDFDFTKDLIELMDSLGEDVGKGKEVASIAIKIGGNSYTL